MSSKPKVSLAPDSGASPPPGTVLRLPHATVSYARWRGRPLDSPEVPKRAQPLEPEPYDVRLYKSGRWTITRASPWQEAPTPPIAEGPRRSTTLTRRGARRIADAGFVAADLGRPFTTFWRFSFGGAELRRGLGAAELSIGSEVRDFLRALRLYYKREGLDELGYAWVAENNWSRRIADTRNPHTHMLLPDRLPKARIQEMWGRGFIKAEKLRVPQFAGVYMLKAAGYMGKAGSSDQGPVRGNRYGVSRNLIDHGELLDVDLTEASHRGLTRARLRAREQKQVVRIGSGVVGAHFATGDGGARELAEFLHALEGPRL